MTGVATESVPSTANWFDALASIVGFTRARRQVLAQCRRFAGRGVVTGRAHTAVCTPASARQHDGAGIVAVADATPPSAFLVVSGALGFGQPGAIIGELLAHRLAALGAVGHVNDLGVRDVAAIEASGLTVYGPAAMPYPASFVEDPVFVVGTPAAVFDVTVRPGDLIVADDDGVVCIPPELVDQVGRTAARIAAVEAAGIGGIRAGETVAAVHARVKALPP